MGEGRFKWDSSPSFTARTGLAGADDSIDTRLTGVDGPADASFISVKGENRSEGVMNQPQHRSRPNCLPSRCHPNITIALFIRGADLTLQYHTPYQLLVQPPSRSTPMPAQV